MVCAEVKVYIAFQLAQAVFQYFFFGSMVYSAFIKTSTLLTLLGLIALLLLLCDKGYRRFTWWFVATAVTLGVIVNASMVLSPTMKKTILELANRKA